MKPIVRRAIFITGAVVLLVIAFGAGAWLGADFVGNLHGSYALPRANAHADLLYRKLLLLDREDAKGLREEINMELDSELFGMCVLAKARSNNSADVIASANETLQRIARYRSERPPIYPAAYAAQVDANVRNRLQACLDEALVARGK